MGNNTQGFTLIEVLFSMLVLSIGLLAVAVMQISAIKGNGQASRVTLATALIEEKLDGYKSMDYDDIDDETETKGLFALTTEVKANTPINALKTITVTASWTDGGNAHSLSFGTIVAK